MAPHQWSPLQQHPRTGEPYLRLPAPHQSIILTPFRIEDKKPILEILNDPKVYMTLAGPPYPYLPEHADWWIADQRSIAEALLETLAEAENAGTQELIAVNGCPVRVIREQREDGTELFLGDLAFVRSAFLHVLNEKARQNHVKENNEKKVGDPTILWEVGNYLRTSHHGRGITTAVLQTIMSEWIIPRTKVRHAEALIFAGNAANVRVYEKNGFVLKETVEGMYEVVESKGGGKKSMHMLEWKAQDA